MRFLTRELSECSKLYHIYTDSNIRYVGGSAGLCFWKGNLIMAIRQTSNIPIGGKTHFNYSWIENGTVPYLNSSVVKIGSLELNNDIIKLPSKTLDIPSMNSSAFRGLEDGRLVIWGDDLWIYGTQFTEEDPWGGTIMAYKLDENFNIIETKKFPGRYELGCQENICTEKNWMAIPGVEQDFIYMIGVNINDPGEMKPCYAIKYSQLNLPENFNIYISNFKGSTPLLKTKDGWMSIIHESYNLDYIHHLMFLDEKMNIKEISSGFYWEQSGIEFVIGLDRKDDDLYICYSTTDGTTNLLVVNEKDLIRIIKNPEKSEIYREDHIKIAEKLFREDPMSASQYYWKSWIQTGNKDALYSHYAILLYWLDKWLLPESLPELENDESPDALILKTWWMRRIHGKYQDYYNIKQKINKEPKNFYINYYKLKNLI